MKSVSLEFFLESIKDQYTVNLELEIGYLYVFMIDNHQYIGTSEYRLETGYPGTILGEYTDNQLFLYPSLLGYIKNFSHIRLQQSFDILTLSHGGSIEFTKPDGFYLIENRIGNVIGFGSVSENVFTPLIDLGIYLRFESQ